MGTPRQLSKFSVREMHDTLSLAREIAVEFRSLDSRVQALDHLKVSLFSMVEWLDKPIRECFPGPESSKFTAPMKRAMPIFKRFGKFSPVALARKGDWVTHVPGDAKTMSVTSGWLAMAISHSRHDILGAIPWGHKKESLVTAESMGMGAIIEHCAFLKYLALGMEEIDKALMEREQRLHTMRHNFSFLKSFAGGLDPFEYGAPKSPLPGYALFGRHSQGTSRCSGTYFVPEPVERDVVGRNQIRPSGSDYTYYVFDDAHRQFRKLEDFLSRVGRSIEEVIESGVFKRDPLSDEEKKVISDFAKGIGNYAK